MKNRPTIEYVKERYKNAKKVRTAIKHFTNENYIKDIENTEYVAEHNTFYADNGKIALWCDGDFADILEYKGEHPKTKAKDPIVNNVIEQFLSRSNEGIEKYGTTLSNNNKDDFLQHLKEELMDAILYIEKMQEQIKEVKKFFN